MVENVVERLSTDIRKLRISALASQLSRPTPPEREKERRHVAGDSVVEAHQEGKKERKHVTGESVVEAHFNTQCWRVSKRV